MSGKNELSTFQRYLTLFIVSLAAGVIFKVAYLREIFYEPLMQALDVSNTELGLLSSVYGMGAMICYLPGGFIADKFKPKTLLVFSLVGSGLLTLWYATIPSFEVLVFIMGAMAVTTILTFWAAYVKAVRILGGKNDQGKFFGYAEGIRAVTGMGVAFAALGIVEVASSALDGLQYTLLFYGVLYVALGVLTAILLPNEDDEEQENAESIISLAGIKYVLQMKGVWLVSTIVFAAYAIYALQSYTTPYLQNVYAVPTALVGTIAIIRQYGIGIFSSPLAGIVADKVGSPTKTVMVFLALALVCALGFLVVPHTASYWIVIALTLATAFMCYALRGIQFATMGEADIPKGTTGAAVGMISVIGYSPDAFIYTIAGDWLDSLPVAEAYNNIFALMAGFVALGFIGCAGILLGKKKEKQSVQKAVIA